MFSRDQQPWQRCDLFPTTMLHSGLKNGKVCINQIYVLFMIKYAVRTVFKCSIVFLYSWHLPLTVTFKTKRCYNFKYCCRKLSFPFYYLEILMIFMYLVGNNSWNKNNNYNNHYYKVNNTNTHTNNVISTQLKRVPTYFTKKIDILSSQPYKMVV